MSQAASAHRQCSRLLCFCLSVAVCASMPRACNVGDLPLE